MPRLTVAAAGDQLDESAFAALLSGRNRDGTIYTLPVTNLIAEAASLGRVKIVGTGNLTAGVAGNVRVTIANPADSGVNLIIPAITALATVNVFAAILINPTAGLPTTARTGTLNAAVGGGVPRKAVVNADVSTTTAMSGGTDTGVGFLLGANSPRRIDLPPLIVAPGLTLGVAASFTAAFTMAASVHLLEDPI